MERKLRLVPPPPAERRHDGAAGGPMPRPLAGPDDEAPLSEEERAAAEALRDALDRREDPLAEELRAAFAPQPIADADLDAVLARALGDESAATSAERAAADRLRAELAGEAPLREAAILEQLRVAARPPALAPEKNEALIDAALSRADQRRAAVRRIAPITMAALASVTAIAAGIALLVGQPKMEPAPSAALIRARSSQDLFDPATPFPRSGEESARIDRIAAARASDLRANRFAAWGVR